MRMLTIGLMAALATMAAAPSAEAAVLEFSCITPNAAAECAAGESQFAVEVIAGSGDQVGFVFTNVGANASSITDVYFDDGTLLGIASIASSPGVTFTQLASPRNLPGGASISPAFETTADFSADSSPPVQPSGVNPGESLTIYFNLQGGGTLADVLAELADGRLRIGIHGQGFANGGSASFVNVPLPEPGSLALLAAAAGLAALRRRARS